MKLKWKSVIDKTDLETAEILNAFFSKIVQNLDITKYTDIEDFFT